MREIRMREIQVVLAASLLANVFLAGALAGGALWYHRQAGWIAAGSLRVPGSELPEAERKAFRAALREARTSMHATVLEGHAALADAAQLMRSPDLDQPALLKALERVRSAEAAVRGAVEQRAVAFAATLPPADRAQLADAMQRRARIRQP